MTKRMLLTVLALVGVAIASYLTLYKVGAIGTLSCSVGSCETVNTSRWSVFLGLPVAAWGLAFYVFLFAVAVLSIQPRWADSLGASKLLLALTGWGVLFSGWLTYLELFVIHAICVWCVASAILVTVMFVISLLEFRERRAGIVDDGLAGDPDAEGEGELLPD
jgi:uncharacterized membrane protein